MAKDWKYINHLQGMRAGYLAKMREYKSYGPGDRNNERYNDSRESVIYLIGEIRRNLKTSDDLKKWQNEILIKDSLQ